MSSDSILHRVLLDFLSKAVHSGGACLPSTSHACLGQRNACTALADMCRHVQQAEAAANAQQNEAFEIDQWILDFANLFREQLNIEPDKHLDLTNMGWDKLQAALDSAVQSDKAPAIFDAAADKFQEVSAHGEPLLCIHSLPRSNACF